MSPKWWINLLLLSLHSGTVAQERPFFTDELYSNVTHRQPVCDLHKAYYAGDVEFRDALNGINISILVAAGDLFKVKEDDSIDPEYPGLIGVLLDELALRGGFSWRNSFAIYDGPGVNKSYTELLQWSSEAYDVTADWWIHSVERLKLGIGFPEGFYDASYILIGLQGESSGSSLHMNLFNWLEPFGPGVWWATLGTIIMSALIYMVLESIDSPEKYHWRFVWNLFLSVLSFTQHFQFHPKSYSGRVFSASMAFWSLIMIATYTANLASFFVVQNTPPIQINNIEDAIRASMSICLWGNTGSADYATSTYPQGIFVMMETEKESFLGVKRGDCNLALASIKSWERLESDKSVNGDCDLAWVGRVVKFIDAGFALQNDAGVKCTSLIQDVLNVHLVEMHADGFIEAAWEESEKKNQDLDCNSVAIASDTDSSQLSLDEMAGPFFLHFLATLLAFAISGVAVLQRKFITGKPRRYSGAIEELNAVDIPDMSPPGQDSARLDSENTQHLSDMQEQLQELKDCQMDLMRAQDDSARLSSDNTKNLSDMQEQLQELRDCQMDLMRAQDEQKAQTSGIMTFLQENLKNNTLTSS